MLGLRGRLARRDRTPASLETERKRQRCSRTLSRRSSPRVCLPTGRAPCPGRWRAWASATWSAMAVRDATRPA